MTDPLQSSGMRRAAFTLIEMISVIAIMLTVAALTIPGISSALNGVKITGATQTVADEIQIARATALARNAPVEVWFFRDASIFRAVRSSILNADNTTTWISRTRRLPDGVAIASAEKYSNIIGAQNLATPPDSPAGTQGVRLRIFPSGKLELVDVLASAQPIGPNQPLFVTVVPSAGFDPNSSTDLPRNFATLQINPINARLTTHRP